MHKKLSGFTIVELLVVIVVIAILATVSVVAYRGISDRANDTAVQSDIRNYVGKIAEFYAINGNYPVPKGDAMGALEGIPVFSFAKNSYAADKSNFYYCQADDTFAVGAVSKSGNKYYYRPDIGLASYTGAWGGASTNCLGMGMSESYKRKYFYDSGSGWAAWTQ